MSEAPGEVRGLLCVRDGEKLFYMERVRLKDGTPVIFERRYVAGALCPGLKEEDVSGSLYRLLGERYGLTIEGADQSIRAVNLRG